MLQRKAGAGRTAGPLSTALAALARRSMTEAQVADLLRRRGFGGREGAETLARLRDLGYVDDARYAAAFVASRAASRGWGPGRLRAELARRGVARSAIDAAIAEASEEGGPASAALDRALERAIRARGLPADREGRDRLRAALRRRGFSAGDAARAVAGLKARRAPGDES